MNIKRFVAILTLLSNLIAGALFFSILLLGTTDALTAVFKTSLSATACLVTLYQLGRFLSSNLAILLEKYNIKTGLLIAFISYLLSSLFIYSASSLVPLLFLGAFLLGIGHSLSNIELRYCVTSNSNNLSLNNFTIINQIGWLFGILIIGVSSTVLHNMDITLICLSMIALSALYVIAKNHKIYTSYNLVLNKNTEEHHSPNKNMSAKYWIAAGALLNSMQVTLFNSSIVNHIKTNLQLNNFELSIILSPVFLTGLIIMVPNIQRYLNETPHFTAWQSTQYIRLFVTYIVIQTTSLLLAIITLPLFGFLMSLGVLFQLCLIKTNISLGEQKSTHSISEIGIVIGGVLVTVISYYCPIPDAVIAINLALLIVWSLFAKTAKRR